MAINVKDKLVTVEGVKAAFDIEAEARDNADQALSDRIDNIIAPEGDPSLSEVSDARTNKNGTVYNTLKARLDADVSATEAEISALNGSLGDVRTPNGINLIDESILKSGSGISYDGSEYVGTADAFKNAFTSKKPIPVDIVDTTKRYTLSFKAYTDGNVSTSGIGLQFRLLYSDDTYQVLNIQNSTSEWHTFSVTSGTDLTKSIVGVYCNWGSGGANVFHIKELMLNSGTTARDYVPYYTANDRVARASISQIDATVDTMEETLKDVRNIIEYTPKASGTQYLNYPMKAGTTYAITTTGQVTLVLRDANGTELENTGTLYRDRVNYFTPSYDSVRCSYWTSLTTDTMRIEEVGTIEYDTHQNTKDVFYLKSGVPSYFESMVSSAASEIREKMNAAGRDGDAFIFITDIHWPRNQKNSPYLCRYIMEHTNVPFIICGGDMLTQTTRSSAISQITAVVQAFTFKNKFFAVAFGNHDDNWNGYGNQHDYPERYLDISDEYALFGKQCDGKVTWLTTTEMSFYFDNVTTKTRYFVLDTGDDGNTGAGNRVFSAKNELATALSEVQSGWHIIFVMHIVTYGQIDSWISPLLDAYKARTSFDGHDFTNAVGEVVMIIGGHTHKDENKSTTGGIPIIVTACDAASQSKVEGIEGVDVSGTTNEQCIDTVIVNYSDRVIDCIRVGYGQSRQFTY